MQSSHITGGGGWPWLIFLLLLQLSAVEAGGSTAFVYANFSVPVVKVRGGPARASRERGRGDAALVSRLSQGFAAEPVPMPNPNPGAP